MSFLKKSFECNFTQVPNHIINDSNVSLKAKGLYLYMVSKPDNWEFSLNGMVSQLKESKTAILRILDELLTAGYMDKIKSRKGNRQATNDYLLHLEPQLRSEYQNETLKMRLSKCDSQNDTTSNTNKAIKKEKQITTLRERDFKSFKSDFISNKKGQLFNTNNLGWLPDTDFTLNEHGLILNTVSGKILTKEEAYKVWKYLFQLQNTA